MNFILEFIFELLFDGAVVASQSKRVPKWIRVILLVLLGVIYLLIVMLMIVFTLMVISQKEYTMMVIMIVVDLVFIIAGFIKVREVLRKRRII